ncbi:MULTISPECIES: LysR family transcriptional regulator [unclassified Pseudoalteromonas]|uniref:LysR family transcriptional regulator n=2 Tax=unclassified Pseudoalteromonas TaxID=194690 RepID=UPI000C7CF123|nr:MULTISPECIES: LysR family transcriptional regulator [unclassified Pseudoalteromonas]AUJ70631.1 HTH-type transcriptional regulator DmlR [Pseudoalteromonas sp. NC201]MCF2825480.1 LysR family transcriptional regulator [Pseudoalteromonas sp. OF5H-5]MCF2831960.1 LysR family transcriptional regulator [Pseudoalteromonas sp. DL2-H6]MCF2923141.1 LysR family transcriptional regulator [Pseudoalteromonas sp. DL2-H1]
MKNNYSLDDMRLFWVVTQHGSFSQAAQSLNMPVSTLSRRIKQLENTLGLRLLNRDAHRVTLTGSGAQYAKRCGPLLSELQDISDALSAQRHEAHGCIRISAPSNLAQHQLAHIFSAFLHAYPGIKIELSLSNRNIDIEGEHIDIAFRASEHFPQDWIARPLGSVESIICASPDMAFNSDIVHPKQLLDLPVILSNPVRVWKLHNQQSGEQYSYTPSTMIRLEADDLNVVSQAVRDGLGIGFIPRFIAQHQIDQNLMIQLVSDWAGQSRRLMMLYHDRVNMPYRLRLFIDYMLEHYGSINPRLRDT